MAMDLITSPKFLIVASTILSFVGLGLFLVLRSDDNGQPSQEAVRNIALFTGGDPVTVQDDALLFQIEGKGELPWVLTGYKQSHKTRKEVSFDKKGWTRWHTEAARLQDNWIALIAPKPEQTGNIPLDHPLVRMVLKIVLGDELGGELSKSSPTSLGTMVDDSFLVISHHPEKTRQLLNGPGRTALETWTNRWQQDSPKLVLTLGDKGIELKLANRKNDPALLADVVKLGTGLTQAILSNR